MRGRTHGRAPRGAPRRPRDAGYTLVEVIIAIALMGTIVIAVLTATTAGLQASTDRRAAARVETAIVNAADRVNRAPSVCDYSVYVQAAVLSQGWAAGAATVAHEHYVPGATPGQGTPGTWAPGACILDEPTDLLVQRITIRITSPEGHVQRSIQVVKSDV